MAVTIWVCGWPLVMNFVAKKTWNRVPCAITRDTGRGADRFFYVYDKIRYANYYQDFWDLGFGYGDTVKSSNLELPDGHQAVCYVNPSNPNQAVLYLVGIDNINRSGRSLGISGAVIVTAVLLPWFAKRKKQVRR